MPRLVRSDVRPARPARRIRLSRGRRARTLGDDFELIVARALGRTLRPWESALAQVGLLVLFGGLLWSLVAADLGALVTAG